MVEVLVPLKEAWIENSGIELATCLGNPEVDS